MCAVDADGRNLRQIVPNPSGIDHSPAWQPALSGADFPVVALPTPTVTPEPRPAPGPLPLAGGDGRIASASGRSGGVEIDVTNPDGSGQR